jgi:ferritin-like metal-binding protein YciE
MAAKEEKALDDLFEETLKDILYAENKILKALPKMAKAAQSEELKAAFDKHLKETAALLVTGSVVMLLGSTAPCLVSKPTGVFWLSEPI